MSSTNRGTVREKNDRYLTPAWCVDRLFENHNFRHSLGDIRAILEPCAGSGDIALAVEKHLPNRAWSLCDLDEANHYDLQVAGNQESSSCICDFLEMSPEYERPVYDLIVTNPPFKLAMEFVKQSFKEARSVAMLLRLNWLASASRQEWMRMHTPDVYVLPNRPDFTGSGGDATEYCWACWHDTSAYRSTGTVEILGLTPLDVRRPKTNRRANKTS